MKRISTCECGRVEFEAYGDPIVSAVCYCVDCQAASKKIKESFEHAKVLDPDGGTAYSTFQRSYWVCTQGGDLLEGVTLNEKSPTTRYIASCCHSPIYLKFKYGFWVSTYRAQFRDSLPPLEWRNKIDSRQSDLPFPDDILRFKGFPLRMFWRLIKAKLTQKPKKKT